MYGTLMDQHLIVNPSIHKLGSAIPKIPEKEFDNLQTILLSFLIMLAKSKEWKANDTKRILVQE